MGSNQFSNSLFGLFIHLNENVLTITMENIGKQKRRVVSVRGREEIVDGQRIA